MHQVKKALCALAIFGCTIAFADRVYRAEPITAYWTGAVSGEWTNRLNWVVKDANDNEQVAPCPPGVLPCCEATYGNLGSKNDTAVFDRASSHTSLTFPTFTDTALKTAWSNGFASISNVIIRGASTPTYTFGSSIYCALPLCHHGTFKIESDVTKTQKLQSFSMGTYAVADERAVTLENDSSAALLEVLGWPGYCSNDPDGAKKDQTGFDTTAESHIYLTGAGTIQFDMTGNGARPRVILGLQQSGTGKMRIASTSPYGWGIHRIEVARPDLSEQIIETTASNANFSFADANVNQLVVAANQRCRVQGPGIHRFVGTSAGNGMEVVNEGAVLEIDGKLSCCNFGGGTSSAPAYGLAFKKYGTGTLRLNNAANDIPGTIETYKGVVEFAKFGNVGEASPIGTGDGIASSGDQANPTYTGAGESTDKRIYVDSAWTRFTHDGTGDLTFTGTDPISRAHANGEAKIYLFNPNGNLVTFNESIIESNAKGTLWLALRSGEFLFKKGILTKGHLDLSAGVTVTTEGDISAVIRSAPYNGDCTINVVGGQDAPVARTVNVLSNETGICNFNLKGQVALTINTILINSGKINIVTDSEGSSLTLTGATQATTFGDKLTINSEPVSFTDEGVAYPNGKITGDVDVTASGRTQTALLNDSNDYTGYTRVYGLLGASIYAAFPTSIPDYTKVDILGGHVTLPFVTAYGYAGWSAAQMLALAGQAHILSNGVVCADTTYSGNRTVTLTDGAITGSELRFGHDGTNTLTLTGTTTKKTHLKAYNGTLEIKDATMNLGGVQAAWSQHSASEYGYGGNNFGTIVITNSTVALSDTEPVVIGGDDGATYSTEPKKPYVTGDALTNNGRLLIRDSVMTSPLADTTSANLVPGGTGGVGAGLVEVEGNSTVTAKICVASVQYGDRAGFYQRGGRVYNRGSNQQRIAYMGPGSYQLDDGAYQASVLAKSSMGLGVNASLVDGFFLQFGGTSAFVGDRYDGYTSSENNSCLCLGAGANNKSYGELGNGWLYVGGGTMTLSNLVIKVGPPMASGSNVGGGMASITVDGAGSKLVIASHTGANFSYGARTLTSFNIRNGGELATAASLSLVNRTGIADRLIHVNFDGGILTALSSGNIFGDKDSTLRAACVNVFEKGATIDTNGKNVGLYVSMVAPAGKGVDSVTVRDGAESVLKGQLVAAVGMRFGTTAADYVPQAPQAFCLVDPHANKITNTVVVCPGWGYEATPTAKLRYDRDDTLAAGYVDVTMRDLSSGGVTYRGGGTATLGIANTYGGATTVATNTTVVCAADNVFPAGQALTFEDGATVDFGGTVQVPGSVRLEGSVTVDGCAQVVWPTTGSVVAGGSGTVFNAAVNFADGTTIALVNPEAVAAGRSCTLMTFNAGYSGTLPTFSGLPKCYDVRLVGNRLRLFHIKGLLIMIK